MNGELEQRWNDLLFGVRRSVRYHNRRRRFFERYHTITTALSVLAGAATVVMVLQELGPLAPSITAALVTVLATFDLVVGTTAKAREHAEFARRFIELEKEMLTSAPDEQRLKEFTAERLDIEADEPPPLHVLNVICHNELVRALGYGQEHLVPLKWYQRLLAHFFDIREGSLSPP